MPNWKKLVTSGSKAKLQTLEVNPQPTTGVTTHGANLQVLVSGSVTQHGLLITGSSYNGIPLALIQTKGGAGDGNGEFIYGKGNAGENSFRIKQGAGGSGTFELYSSQSYGNQFITHKFGDPLQSAVSYVNYSNDSRSNAYFGIGVNNPTAHLHVSGNITQVGGTARFGTNSVYVNGDAGTISASGTIFTNSHITASGKISSSGDIITKDLYVKGGDIYNVTDIRPRAQAEPTIQFNAAEHEVEIGDPQESVNRTVFKVDDVNQAFTFKSVADDGYVDITLDSKATDFTGDTGALRCEGGASIAKDTFFGAIVSIAGNVQMASGKSINFAETAGAHADTHIAHEATNGRIKISGSSDNALVVDSKYANVGIGAVPHTNLSNSGLTVNGDISASGDFILGDLDDGAYISASAGGGLGISGSGIGQLQVDHRLFDTGSATVGSAGGAIGDTVKFGDSSGLTAGKCYYLDTDGHWEQSDANYGGKTSGSIAIATNAAATNGMALRGVVKLSHDPGGNIGAPLYLSAGGTGLLTSAVPGSGDYVRVVGYNLDESGLIFFNPGDTTIKVS